MNTITALAPADGIPSEEADPGVLIDCADIPGGGRLYLVRHGSEFEILLGDEQLMGSWAHHSETALAQLVCGRLSACAPRVLIGGLGMGFTLAAAREALPTNARIVVSELVPSVVTWARGALSHLFEGALDDPRGSIQVRDVHDVIDDQANAFDAILLDVDNGPEGLVTLANERLYCIWGLRAAWRALTPGGILAVWSAFPDEDFRRLLQSVGFDVEEISIDSDGTGRDAPHIIWLATRTISVA